MERFIVDTTGLDLANPADWGKWDDRYAAAAAASLSSGSSISAQPRSGETTTQPSSRLQITGEGLV